ncbi:MAG: inositol monophosphatase family protein [Candidatus Glassbacteria bacterium]
MYDPGSASPWVKFGLQLAVEAVRRVSELAPESGAEVVQQRDTSQGSYRYWDPETLRVDKDLEEFFIERLTEEGIDAVMLSEEAGRRKIERKRPPQKSLDQPVYFVSDPFDGSLLYKRSIPAFWYSALAIYTRPENEAEARPLVAIVADCSARTVYFCDAAGSYECPITTDYQLGKAQANKPNDTRELREAFLETYLMKPHYLYPGSERFKFLLNQVKFILPNGGPSGFCDVASGKVDIYFAFKQPHTDIFPGIAIAQKAGCTVTTFEGREVNFEARVENRYNIVCSANQNLHAKVLDLLKANRITDNLGIKE